MSDLHKGLPVEGHRPQPMSAVDLVNANERMEEVCLRRLDMLAAMPGIDKRWLAIGRTELQQAWMAINRAITVPSRVMIPVDAAKGD